MKQGIEKVLEEFDEEFPESKYFENHSRLAFEGADDKVKSFLRSAIETAFKEVRPYNLDTAGDVSEGYNDALLDYDENVKSFLGK